MATFTLENTPYQDGTTVYAYDATGYPSGFPGANPPGDPVETVEALNFSVAFKEVQDGVPYVAAGKVNGEWRYVRFTPDASTPSLLEAAILAEAEARQAADSAHASDTTDIHGISDTAPLTEIADLKPSQGEILIHDGGKWDTARALRFTPDMFGAKGDSTGAAGTGTDDSKPVQEAVNAAIEYGAEFYCEKYYRTTKKIEGVTDTFFGNGIGTGNCGIIPDTSDYDAFVVGPGAEGSGTRFSGYVRNFDIGGGNCAVNTAGAAKVTGHAAFKLNGLRNFEISIRVKGAHDIAFDSENNCYGTTYNMARVEYDAARVGINFRKGAKPGNGEDQLLVNCWISGEVAALHITSGKNYKVIGGQLSASRQAAVEEDGRGIVILGKDYLGLEGAEDTAVTLWTSFESCQRCWTIRAFKRVNITAHSFFNVGTDTAAALGFYKSSAHGNSVIRLDGCGFGGSEFSKPASEIVIREGFSSGSTWEERGSWGDYKDGTGETDALWDNMARRAEIPRAVGSRDGDIFYFQGMEFKVTSGVLEYSELHKESWRALSPKTEELAAASTMTISPGTVLVKVTGGGEIKEIEPTFNGHRVVLRGFASSPKIIDGGNLKIAGNFETTPDDTIELICNGTNWFELGRSVN